MSHHPRFPNSAVQERAMGLPTPYQIFRYMTGSEHMHFGLFASPEEDFGPAQDRMMEKLLGFFPEEAKTVVDCGCGIGGTSINLAERGHIVVGFAPEEGLIQYARARASDRGVAERTTFHAARLQDVPPRSGPFDVLLTQESMQYIHPIEETLERFHSLVRPGGRVVIGDQVLRQLEHRSHVQFHVSDEVRTLAAKQGFTEIHHEDVTEMAKHTGPRSLQVLRDNRDDIISLFKPFQPNIEKDLDVCIDNGAVEASWYDDGRIGYEVFVFERT